MSIELSAYAHMVNNQTECSLCLVADAAIRRPLGEGGNSAAFRAALPEAVEALVAEALADDEPDGVDVDGAAPGRIDELIFSEMSQGSLTMRHDDVYIGRGKVYARGLLSYGGDDDDDAPVDEFAWPIDTVRERLRRLLLVSADWEYRQQCHAPAGAWHFVGGMYGKVVVSRVS